MGKLIAMVSLGLFLTFNSEGHVGPSVAPSNIPVVVSGVNGGTAPAPTKNQNVFDNQVVRECRHEATLNLGQMIKSIFDTPCVLGTDQIRTASTPVTTQIGS